MFFKDLYLLFKYIYFGHRYISKAHKLLHKDRELSLKYFELAEIFGNRHKLQEEKMNTYEVWHNKKTPTP